MEKDYDYEPYSQEWEKEMMKFPKPKLIEWLRKELIIKYQDWTLSREKMPDFDGPYLVAGFMHTECGNIYEFQRVVECRMNQWVKNDVGEQMTLWRPLLPFPKLEKYSDHEKH